MNPNEALAKAAARIPNYIAGQDTDRIGEILSTAMTFYSENTVVEQTLILESTDDLTVPITEGIFTLDLPDDFRDVLGICDDDGIEQSYRLTASQLVIRKCEESLPPYEFKYAMKLIDWDIGTDLPAKMRIYPLIDLIYGYLGDFNNECLKKIGKLTDAADESTVDFQQKIESAKESIKNIVYIPPPKMI